MSVAIEQCVPPLAAGDKLTRDEFLRRWEACPGIKRAELIGGTVYMPSPLSRMHGDIDAIVCGWLVAYMGATPGVACGHNSTALVLEDSPQPDINLRILPEYGGHVSEEGLYIQGAPELIAEICGTSASYDLHDKLDLYQAAGVREYLTVLIFEQEIRWHVLVRNRYELLPADSDGLWRSRIFPGLWLDGKPLFARDVHDIMARLQEGLSSTEHQQV